MVAKERQSGLGFHSARSRSRMSTEQYRLAILSMFPAQASFESAAMFEFNSAQLRLYTRQRNLEKLLSARYSRRGSS